MFDVTGSQARKMISEYKDKGRRLEKALSANDFKELKALGVCVYREPGDPESNRFVVEVEPRLVKRMREDANITPEQLVISSMYADQRWAGKYTKDRKAWNKEFERRMVE